MARPKIKGLLYFPFDIDFFEDNKIRIVKARYRSDGVMIYLFLLCEIYRQGYYIKADEDFLYIISDELGIMSKRVMAKDQEKDIDSNMLDQLFCDFVQEVIDKYSVIKKQGDYVEYCNVESVYYDNAETVLGNSIRNAVEKRFPWMIVRKAKKASIIDRIRCTIRLMGAGRFWITEDCKSLQTALSDAVWNKDVKDKDERLDDGSTDIDSLDAFEYTIERDMRDLIEEVEDV